MSDESKLCPKCKKGKLRPIGKDSVQGEKDGQFRETSNTRELICDNCGQRQVNVGLNEYLDISDRMDTKVNKANPDKKE